MNLTLSLQEAEILQQVLEAQISQMHSEINHTDNSDFRERLKSRRQVLQQLFDRLAKLPVE